MRVGGDGGCGGAHGESIPPENNALRNFLRHLLKGWVLKNTQKQVCCTKNEAGCCSAVVYNSQSACWFLQLSQSLRTKESSRPSRTDGGRLARRPRSFVG